jgi:hypothetical protein
VHELRALRGEAQRLRQHVAGSYRVLWMRQQVSPARRRPPW